MAPTTATLSPALAAYAKAAERVGNPAEAAGAMPAQSFAAVLEQTLGQAVDAGRRGELTATQAASGAAALQDVVEAVNAAELSLQAVVAVRDRLIAAYQEVMRMPI